MYKVTYLGVKEAGLFKYRGKTLKMSHILPRRHREMNILEEYRSRFFASESSRIKLHRFFHHLNSSQAMCINLFYPLIAEDLLTLVTSFLGIPSACDLISSFEKESPVEAAVRRTFFDFHIQHSRSHEIFFEVKYTEHGFAKAKKDEEHKQKYKDTYRPLLHRSVYLADICQDETFFLNHYQVLRNLVHIGETKQLVLLFPAGNSAVRSEADRAFKEFLTDAGRSKVKIVLLEDLLSYFESECSQRPIAHYYDMFRRKYLPSKLLRPNTYSSGQGDRCR
jgi:hypothetical protein